MKRNQIILIYGLPASGKYTIAKQVSEKCGGILLDNHYFYDMFLGITEVANNEKTHNKFTQSVAIVRNAYMDVLRKFHPHNRHIRYIFTGVLLRGEDLPIRLQKFAHDINADFIPIELNIRKEILLERCDTDQRRKREKLSNKTKYNELLNEWLPNTFHSKHKNRLIIESSDLTPEETFKKVKKTSKKI